MQLKFNWSVNSLKKNSEKHENQMKWLDYKWQTQKKNNDSDNVD